MTRSQYTPHIFQWQVNYNLATRHRLPYALHLTLTYRVSQNVIEMAQVARLPSVMKTFLEHDAVLHELSPITQISALTRTPGE